MSFAGTKRKAKMGGKAAKTATKHPKATRTAVRASAPMAKLAVRIGMPVAKRRGRQRVEQIGDTVRTTGQLLATYGPQTAQALGLTERPKRKRTLPRVALGVLIGAGAMYFFGPQRGG